MKSRILTFSLTLKTKLILKNSPNSNKKTEEKTTNKRQNDESVSLTDGNKYLPKIHAVRGGCTKAINFMGSNLFFENRVVFFVSSSYFCSVLANFIPKRFGENAHWPL